MASPKEAARIITYFGRPDPIRKTIHPHCRLRHISGSQACVARRGHKVTGIDVSANGVRVYADLPPPQTKIQLDNLRVCQLPIEGCK